MEQVEMGCVEFLDLSGIEEHERNWLLSSLFTWNPNIQLPWGEDGVLIETSIKQQKHIGVTTNINLNKVNQQHLIYNQPPYISPGQSLVCLGQVYTQPNLPAVPLPNSCYTQPEVITNLQSNNINNNNNNVNYICNDNSNTYINDTYTNGAVNNQCSLPVQNEIIENGIQSEIEENHITTEETVPVRKSWASLFNKSNSTESTNEQKAQEVASNKFTKTNESIPTVDNATLIELKEPFRSNADDPNLHRMGEFLASHTVDNRIISLQPRGLINKSNYCYINSILQAVLACPPLYNLLIGLAENSSAATEKKKITPTIDSMTKFVQEFHHLPAGMRVGRRLDKNQKKELLQINCDIPFEPSWLHKLLNGMRTDTFVVEGRQEDAEEFLGCLLNGLNDEMLELMKLVGSRSRDDNYLPEEDKEWQVMGPKNKGAITRRTEFNRTPVSDIFGGLLRSRLHRTGDQSTDNIQPFFTLQLNIEKTNTVREALDVLVCKNQLEGVTSSKTNEEVEAWQQVTLEELPIVLVLHLKCFDYKLDGCSKIVKALEFPIDLKLDSKLLSSKTNYTAKEKQYKLFAIVYHEGKEATKGHYITDAYHVGYASWLRYDDASVKLVPEEHVLKPHGTRVPYLLFYRRSDSLNKSK